MTLKIHIYIVNTQRNLNGNHSSEIHFEDDFKRILNFKMFEKDFEIGKILMHL